MRRRGPAAPWADRSCDWRVRNVVQSLHPKTDRLALTSAWQVTRPAVNRLAAAYPELAYLDPPSQKTHYGLFYNGFTGQEDQRRWVPTRPRLLIPA